MDVHYLYNSARTSNDIVASKYESFIEKIDTI